MKDAVLVRKVFFAMLIPTILMNAVTCISSAADTIIVGNWLGENALTAITFSTPVYMLINTAGALIAVGGTTVISIAGGRGDKREADEIFSLAIMLCIAVSVIICLLGTVFIEPIVMALGASGELIEPTRQYVIVVFYMTPAFIFNITLAFLVRSDGRPNLAMAGMLISIGANIILDLLFIIPLNMGVAGAAWGTGVSQAISALILASHYLSKKNTQKFVRPVWGKTVLLIKSGAGTSLHFIYQFITILFFNNLIMRLAGGNGIVVYTVVMNVSMIALSIFEGLSQTVQPMFATYYGESNNEAIKATYRLSVTATIVLGGTATALLELFPNALVMLFGVTGEAASSSAAAIRIFSVCIILMTYNVIMGYYYQSTGRAVLAAVIVFLRNLAALLLGAVVLGNLFGLNGIWCAYIFAEVVTFAAWFAFAKHKERTEDATGGILLLPAQADVCSRYIKADLNELHGAITEIKTFFDGRNINDARAGRIMLAVDELVTNVINHGSRKGLSHIEIRIVVKDEILLVIRDDGILFDHSEFTPSDELASNGGRGITLIRKTASSFEYRPVLGLNRTLITYKEA